MSRPVLATAVCLALALVAVGVRAEEPQAREKAPSETEARGPSLRDVLQRGLVPPRSNTDRLHRRVAVELVVRDAPTAGVGVSDALLAEAARVLRQQLADDPRVRVVTEHSGRTPNVPRYYLDWRIGAIRHGDAGHDPSVRVQVSLSLSGVGTRTVRTMLNGAATAHAQPSSGTTTETLERQALAGGIQSALGALDRFAF